MAPLYDVFLSHSNADKPAVETLAQKLVAAGINPFLDKWHLVPGEPWQEGLEEALDRSRTCAVFVGPTGLGPWQNEEMRSFLEDRVSSKKFRVIPVLLEGASKPWKKRLPRFLRRLTWVDFRGGLEDEDALRRLVHGIKGTPPGPIGGGLILPEVGKPRLRKSLPWLGLAVLMILAVFGLRSCFAWKSHVLLLVPGKGIFERLPRVTDPAPSPGSVVYDLYIRFKGKPYIIEHDLRRRPIYLGAAGQLEAAAYGSTDAEWVSKVEGWSGRSLTTGEKEILAAIHEGRPLSLKTPQLKEGETIDVELYRAQDGQPRAVLRESFTIDARRDPQPVFLVELPVTHP